MTNTRSAHQYTVFSPTQLLLVWREQRPSHQEHFDWSVTGEFERVYTTVLDLLLISYLCRITRQLLGCVLNGTLCIHVQVILVQCVIHKPI
jgi:hypothetical protein